MFGADAFTGVVRRVRSFQANRVAPDFRTTTLALTWLTELSCMHVSFTSMQPVTAECRGRYGTHIVSALVYGAHQRMHLKVSLGSACDKTAVTGNIGANMTAGAFAAELTGSVAKLDDGSKSRVAVSYQHVRKGFSDPASYAAPCDTRCMRPAGLLYSCFGNHPVLATAHTRRMVSARQVLSTTGCVHDSHQLTSRSQGYYSLFILISSSGGEWNVPEALATCALRSRLSATCITMHHHHAQLS